MNMTPFHANPIGNGKIALIQEVHMIIASIDIRTIEIKTFNTNCRSGIEDAQSTR